jgi:hypothetical protein
MTNERSAAEQIEQLVNEGTITKGKWDHYGLDTYKAEDGCTYAYAEDDEVADEAAETYIDDMVWSFRSGFLMAYLPKGMTEKVVSVLQEDLCEGANEALKGMIQCTGKWDKFVRDAISSVGRRPLLSQYDGEEQDSDDVGLPAGGYAYRID